MKNAFLWVIRRLSKLWRTLISTLCNKSHLYCKDVDNDGVNEIVVDINGKSNQSIIKEEYNNNDSKSN